jgi:N4-gp56 family major capsid protein
MTVTQTTMPPGIQQNLLGKVLSTPEARRIHRMGAMTYPVPQHAGDILRKKRYRRLETVPVPVDPAMLNPPAQLLNRDFLDVKIHFYATYLIVTEQVVMVDQDPVLNRGAARLQQCLAETEDQLIRDMLEATASVQNCVNGTNADVPTEVTFADAEEVNQILQGNNGDYIEKFMEGANKFGTAPIRDSYLCLTHTDMISQWRACLNYVNKAQYPNPNGTLNLAEDGSLSNLRVFVTSRGSITLNASLAGADVYNSFICAQEGYSCTELEGSKIALTYQPPGTGDDVCHLRSKLGFRFTFGTSIDQDLWVINLRATLA